MISTSMQQILYQIPQIKIFALIWNFSNLIKAYINTNEAFK